MAAIAIALFLPLAAGLGYWQLGSPLALEKEATQPIDPKQMETLADTLAARLEKTPEDAHGWMLLGRARASIAQYDPALKAYARAVQLVPGDPGLFTEFLKTLALAGRAQFERGDYAAAIGYWERILPVVPPQSEFARSVAEGIAEARALAGTAGPATRSAALQGTVSLDPAVAAKASPGDTVFVIARAVEGPRMPLAVARTTVAALPYRFTLDDSMAMAPNAKLSGHDKVIVAARVSKSGKAAPEKGDLEGASAPVAPGTSDIQVVVSRILQ